MRKRKAILGTRSLEDCCRAFKSPQFLIQSMRLKAACTYVRFFNYVNMSHEPKLALG
jgi:hypothetical protein